MTGRLYYDDSYLTNFRARIVERGCDPCEIHLDRTAFYPTSGGQPFDTGEISGVAVIDVVEDGERIRHRVAHPVNADEVECIVDWTRRFDHMQQHSGQHLLSAVLEAMFGAATVSFHLGRLVSTIDVSKTLESGQLRRAEEHANEVVSENRPISVSYEHSGEVRDLRKESEREGVLRIVTIRDFDRSACGGTHVRSTAEIGPILVRKTEKIRNTLRIEFLCGLRAVRRARADFDALSQVARIFSAALDEAPALVAAQQAKLADAEKARNRLALDLAGFRGRELYQQTAPDELGWRRQFRRLARGPFPEEVRTEAQSFTRGAKALFVAICDDPPSVLLAASADSGVHAGDVLKKALAGVGGRGGGNAQLAQGSLPSQDSLVALQGRLDRDLC